MVRWQLIGFYLVPHIVAWFHDPGYVEQVMYNELISARLAVQLLPSFGFTEKQIEIIQNESIFEEAISCSSSLNGKLRKIFNSRILRSPSSRAYYFPPDLPK